MKQWWILRISILLVFLLYLLCFASPLPHAGEHEDYDWGADPATILEGVEEVVDEEVGIQGPEKGLQRMTSILFGVVVILEVFLICRPVSADWDKKAGGTCGNQVASYLALEVIGLLLDLAILLVPVPYIWGLKMRRSNKLKITITFTIGMLVFIITALRLQALNMVNAEDFTYSKGYLGLLSVIGASLGVIFCCATCVPAACNRCCDSRKALPHRLDAIHKHVVHGRVNTKTVIGRSEPRKDSRVVNSLCDEENAIVDSGTGMNPPQLDAVLSRLAEDESNEVDVGRQAVPTITHDFYEWNPSRDTSDMLFLRANYIPTAPYHGITRSWSI
ncbi:hypothetical protein G7Y89_g2252 [Cudoniella acicularis]|uniref:Rhodopsin domain-containing protein n=1 Tax=Cudoniella acicularis TaxID=354080 RepID=A0A8H4RWM2_9HELO|nr:hypothetical protein G7Y89_g2252 [Cudoniella acicularis]